MTYARSDVVLAVLRRSREKDDQKPSLLHEQERSDASDSIVAFAEVDSKHSQNLGIAERLVENDGKSQGENAVVTERSQSRPSFVVLISLHVRFCSLTNQLPTQALLRNQSLMLLSSIQMLEKVCASTCWLSLGSASVYTKSLSICELDLLLSKLVTLL